MKVPGQSSPNCTGPVSTRRAAAGRCWMVSVIFSKARDLGLRPGRDSASALADPVLATSFSWVPSSLTRCRLSGCQPVRAWCRILISVPPSGPVRRQHWFRPLCLFNHQPQNTEPRTHPVVPITPHGIGLQCSTIYFSTAVSQCGRVARSTRSKSLCDEPGRSGLSPLQMCRTQRQRLVAARHRTTPQCGHLFRFSQLRHSCSSLWPPGLISYICISQIIRRLLNKATLNQDWKAIPLVSVSHTQ